MEIKEHPLLPFSLGEKGLQLPVSNQEEIDGAFQRLEAVPHSIVTEILEKLPSQILRVLGVEWGVKDALEKLGSIVLTTTPVLTDAARKRMENEEIGEWLEKFILAVYDADDLVDDFSTEALQRKVMVQEDKYWGTKKVRIFFSSSNQLVFRFKTGRKFKAIRKVLRAIAENRIYISRLTKIDHDERCSSLSTQVGDENNYMMEYYNRKETLSFFVQPAAAADQEEEVVIGREEEKLDIVNKLVDCEFDVSVIPIVGTAGVGKTALAKLVYNDERVTNHFELKMWVFVSDVFDVKMIAKEMIESATGRKLTEKLIHHPMDGVIQDHLRKEIDRKRFLLVLDNVWNEGGDLWLQPVTDPENFVRGGGFLICEYKII
ncbi:disease resistance protein RGA2-like [Cornus florida]|uniref:disease resistance protein RGA2-like n=1 Tax=Cornus florida TaxID=4283 RepID=UPI00289BD972|nr:disease resistance protein RGA2-like [Cornus florida]